MKKISILGNTYYLNILCLFKDYLSPTVIHGISTYMYHFITLIAKYASISSIVMTNNVTTGTQSNLNTTISYSKSQRTNDRQDSGGK